MRSSRTVPTLASFLVSHECGLQALVCTAAVLCSVRLNSSTIIAIYITITRCSSWRLLMPLGYQIMQTSQKAEIVHTCMGLSAHAHNNYCATPLCSSTGLPLSHLHWMDTLRISIFLIFSFLFLLLVSFVLFPTRLFFTHLFVPYLL